MQKILPVLLLLLSSSIAFAQPVTLPAYDSIKGINRYATKAEYESAAADQRYELRRTSYRSDDVNVFAYVYSPRNLTTNLPGVVYNRGGFVRDEFAGELIASIHRLADAGFIVVA